MLVNAKEPAESKGSSRFEFRQLVEMCVVVRDVDAVRLRAREDHEIGERNGQARRPPAIGKSNGALPYFGRNVVIGKQGLITTQRFAFCVVRHAAPQLEPHNGTPCDLAALQQRVDPIALRGLPALSKLMHPKGAIDEDRHGGFGHA